MCDPSTFDDLDPDDPLIAALRRVVSESGPDADVVSATMRFPELHALEEIVGRETSDSASELHAAGVRFNDMHERDLVYAFDEGDVTIRLAPGSLMASLPPEWDVTEVFVQSTDQRHRATVEEDNYVEFFGQLESPLRLAVICEGTIRCTPWTIA